MENQIRSAVWGFVIGDALGVPVEFQPREELKRNPVLGMRGYGTYLQSVGTWSDDSSLMLALMEALSEKRYTLTTIAKRSLQWYEEGAYTPHGVVFDCGISTGYALENLKKGVPPVESGGVSELDNGNGGLMRILPLIFYLHPEPNARKRARCIYEVTGITHAHPRAQMASHFYIEYGLSLLQGKDALQAYQELCHEFKALYEDKQLESELSRYERILSGELPKCVEDDISASSYVVSTLEAVLWSFLTTNSFSECVLSAVNLGEDTDTVTALAGGLAGLYYGMNQIPMDWISEIANPEEVQRVLDQFISSKYVKQSLPLFY